MDRGCNPVTYGSVCKAWRHHAPGISGFSLCRGSAYEFPGTDVRYAGSSRCSSEPTTGSVGCHSVEGRSPPAADLQMRKGQGVQCRSRHNEKCRAVWFAEIWRTGYRTSPTRRTPATPG